MIYNSNHGGSKMIELVECEGCGELVPEDESVDICIARQTLEDPADWVTVCADCGAGPEGD